jgi:tetratricopeptide (TPR) repeat protein
LFRTAHAYLQLGRTYRALKRYDEAEERHRRAIMMDPANVAYHAELGEVLVEHGKLRQAEAECTNVVTLAPGEANSYAARAAVRRRRGDLEGAKRDYESALRIDITHGDARSGLAEVYREFKLPAEALKVLERALPLGSEAGRVMLARGELLMTLKRHEEACEAFRVASKHAEVRVEAHCGRGDSYARRDEPDHDSAAREYRAALQHDPRNVRALTGLGRTHYEAGRFEDAARHLAVARREAPDDELVRLWLSAARLKTGAAPAAPEGTGTVFAWGRGSGIGVPRDKMSTEPYTVGLPGASAVACGRECSAAAMTDGSV